MGYFTHTSRMCHSAVTSTPKIVASGVSQIAVGVYWLIWGLGSEILNLSSKPSKESVVDEICECLSSVKEDKDTRKINCSQMKTCQYKSVSCDEDQMKSLCKIWNINSIETHERQRLCWLSLYRRKMIIEARTR